MPNKCWLCLGALTETPVRGMFAFASGVVACSCGAAVACDRCYALLAHGYADGAYQAPTRHHSDWSCHARWAHHDREALWALVGLGL